DGRGVDLRQLAGADLHVDRRGAAERDAVVGRAHSGLPDLAARHLRPLRRRLRGEGRHGVARGGDAVEEGGGAEAVRGKPETRNQKPEELRRVARIATLVSGFWFLVSGLAHAAPMRIQSALDPAGPQASRIATL